MTQTFFFLNNSYSFPAAVVLCNAVTMMLITVENHLKQIQLCAGMPAYTPLLSLETQGQSTVVMSEYWFTRSLLSNSTAKGY